MTKKTWLVHIHQSEYPIFMTMVVQLLHHDRGTENRHIGIAHNHTYALATRMVRGRVYMVDTHLLVLQLLLSSLLVMQILRVDLRQRDRNSK